MESKAVFSTTICIFRAPTPQRPHVSQAPAPNTEELSAYVGGACESPTIFHQALNLFTF